jgi:outer membrane cobalamin receptor
VTLQLAYDTSNQSSAAISTGLSGNYLFSGDSLPFIPRSNARAFITLERETPRFGVGLTLRGEYVGERQDRTGQVHGDNVALLSFIGTLRFVTLSFIFRIDNVLDDTYAYINGYENAPRNGRFSIKWEFWD